MPAASVQGRRLRLGPAAGSRYVACNMNKHDPGGPEAKLLYGDNEITILRQGLYVRCAVTGERIPLDELRYWNVDLQEAYRGPAEATERWKQVQAEKQK